MEYTPNYNLTKPGSNDYYDVNDFNGNADLIDAALKGQADDMTAHKEAAMPHQFNDAQNSKTYKFGFQLSSTGQPQIIYEEVI